MWLINVETYQLRKFLGQDIWIDYPYAILSHTWELDEVNFQQMGDLQRARSMAGFWKIQRTCEQAKKDGLRWAWVDTCCIDKSSSSELQEAINSMFEWYGRSTRCYAYIADRFSSLPEDQFSTLGSSRWVTRGWTLQELIAPIDVYFFNSAWNLVGTRDQLRSSIADRTGIGVSSQKRLPQKVCSSLSWECPMGLAQRMSWAAERDTSRVEDKAYSLLGLFDIAMPLLYGEGSRAFERLQEEIIRNSADLSILLWQHTPESLLDHRGALDRRLLASEPVMFRNTGSVVSLGTREAIECSVSRALLSTGLRTKMRLHPYRDPESYTYSPYATTWIGILDCGIAGDPTTTVGLALTSVSSKSTFKGAQEQYIDSDGLLYLYVSTVGRARDARIDILVAGTQSELRDVLILRHMREELDREKSSTSFKSFWVRPDGTFPTNRAVAGTYPEDSWDRRHLILASDPDIRWYNGRGFLVGAIALRWNVGGHFWCLVIAFAQKQASSAIFTRLEDPEGSHKRYRNLNSEELSRCCDRLIAGEVSIGFGDYGEKSIWLWDQGAKCKATIRAESHELGGRQMAILHISIADVLEPSSDSADVRTYGSDTSESTRKLALLKMPKFLQKLRKRDSGDQESGTLSSASEYSAGDETSSTYVELDSGQLDAF